MRPWMALAAVVVGSLLEAQQKETQPRGGAPPEVVSALGRTFYAQPDAKGEIARADAALANDPANVDLLLAAARARDGALQFNAAIELYSKGIAAAPGDARLYRFRGHRYISTRRFEAAVKDLEKAATLSPASFDISYHLGLAYYLKGEFRRAADEYARCWAMAEKKQAPPGAAEKLPAGWRSCADWNDDTRVAVADWRYRALRRAGRQAEAGRVLEAISPEMQVKENLSYFQALLFYKGLRREEEILDRAKLEGNQLATIGFGVANFHLVEGRIAPACALWREIVAGETWNAFGFIAAETELARGGACGPARLAENRGCAGCPALARISNFPNSTGGFMALDRKAIEEKVKQIIVEQLGVDESQVDPSASFVEDLGADSLDIVELVMAFEENFKIEIPDEDAEKITTVKDAVDYIENRNKGK